MDRNISRRNPAWDEDEAAERITVTTNVIDLAAVRGQRDVAVVKGAEMPGAAAVTRKTGIVLLFGSRSFAGHGPGARAWGMLT